MRAVYPFAPNDNDAHRVFRALEREIDALYDRSTDELHIIIRRLKQLEDSYPKKCGHIFGMIVHNAKRACSTRHGEEDPSRHELSDHAFCRVLEYICGLDVNEMKDKALQQLETSEDWQPLRKGRTIVTVLKKLEGIP